MLTQHAHIQHVLSYILSHRCTQLSHAVYAYTQHVLTCNTQHDTLPHTGSHVPMHILKHLHMYILTCMHMQLVQTHTDSQSDIHVPPQDAHIHPCRWKKAPEKQTWIHRAGHTYGHFPKTHGQTQKHTIQEPTYKDPHPVSKVDNPQSHKAHKDTQRARSTHRHRGTCRHKVITSCSHTPKSSQKTAGPGTHPGRTVKTQAALSFQPWPSSLSPLWGPSAAPPANKKRMCKNKTERL